MQIEPFKPTTPRLWMPPCEALYVAPQRWRGRRFPQAAIYGKGAGGGGSSVTVDAVGTDFTYSGVNSISGTPITVVTGNLLIVGVVFTTAAASSFPTGVTATWNGVSMTLVPSSTIQATDGTQSVQTMLFQLASPASGAKTLTVNFTGSGFAGYVDAISLNGAVTVTNTTPVTATTGNPSITVASGTGQVPIALFASRGGVGASFSSVNNTQWFLDNSGSVGNGAGNYAAPGSASTTLSAVIGNTSALWCASAVNIS